MDDKAGVRPHSRPLQRTAGLGECGQGDAFQVAFPYELGRASGVVHRVRPRNHWK